jgi:hypothetical protein
VLSEAHRQRLIAGRCWEIYDLITRTFTVQPEFIREFPELAEQALITGALSLRTQIEQDRFLQIVEEYDFREHELAVETYSYLLLNQALDVVIRADSLPHHQRDYRKRRLQHFPHHLHDEKGRIRSFTG